MSNDEIALLNALSDPNNHQKFVDYLESLELLTSFLEAMEIQEGTT